MNLKTSQVLALVGITHDRLFNWIRRGRVNRPRKDASGDFTWTKGDVRALCRAVAAAANTRSGKG